MKNRILLLAVLCFAFIKVGAQDFKVAETKVGASGLEGTVAAIKTAEKEDLAPSPTLLIAEALN